MDREQMIEKAIQLIMDIVEPYDLNYHALQQNNCEYEAGSYRNCLIPKNEPFAIKWDQESTEDGSNGSSNYELDLYNRLVDDGKDNLVTAFYGSFIVGSRQYFLWERLVSFFDFHILNPIPDKRMKEIATLKTSLYRAAHIVDIDMHNVGYDENYKIKAYDFAFDE